MKTSIKITGLIVSAVFLWATLVVIALADSVYISQVQITGGSGHTADDFIELFNPGAAPFNLNGYRLVKRSANGTSDSSVKSWTTDVSIPAGGYFLWANDGFSTISVAPDEVTSATISDDNGIAIRQGSANTGTIIDSLAWGTTNNSFTNLSSANPGAGQSLIKNIGQATFTIGPSNPHNSQSVASTPPPAPSPAPPAPSPSPTPPSPSPSPAPISTPANVKIFRFLPNPVGDDAGSEWVELKNNETSDVDVTGWILDDENTGSGPGSTAFTLSGKIVAGDVKQFVLPAGSFALNNSGGDEVNLYLADKTLADTAVYSAAAGDDEIFEYRDGAWQGPAKIPAPAAPRGTSGGGPNAIVYYGPPAATTSKASIAITEFLPNPSGEDSGNEWVELFNTSSATTSLSGWKLDSKSATDNASANAYAFDDTVVILPKSYLIITIPSGKFSLKNSAADEIRLFKPDNSQAQRIIFADAPEGKSFSVDSVGNWEFNFPTPGQGSIADIPLPPITISELLPNPGEAQEEFVELQNLSTSTIINIENFKLLIGSRAKTLDNATIAPLSFLTIYEDDLPQSLRNSGQTVILQDNFGREVSVVTYEKAEKGQVYAWTGGDYEWTEKSTPGENNEFVLAAATVEAEKVKVKSAAKKSTTINKPNQELEQKLALLEQQVSDLHQQLANADNNRATDKVAASPRALKPDWTGNLALVFSALALLALIFKQFFQKPQNLKG